MSLLSSLTIKTLNSTKSSCSTLPSPVRAGAIPKWGTVTKIEILWKHFSEQFDHGPDEGHKMKILSISACRELMIFCTSSLDGTIAIRGSKNEFYSVRSFRYSKTFFSELFFSRVSSSIMFQLLRDS